MAAAFLATKNRAMYNDKKYVLLLLQSTKQILPAVGFYQLVYTNNQLKMPTKHIIYYISLFGCTS